MRIILGLIVSIAWLAAVAFYVDQYVGVENLLGFLPTEIAVFAGAVVLPLVLVWVAAGAFEQAATQRRSAAVLRDLVANQAQAAAAQLRAAHCLTLLRSAELIERELGTIARRVAEYLPAPKEPKEKTATNGGAPPDDVDAAFAALLDPARRGTPKALRALLDKRTAGRSLMIRYCDAFEALVSDCDACDINGRLRQHYERSVMGEVYRLFGEALDRKPA